MDSIGVALGHKHDAVAAFPMHTCGAMHAMLTSGPSIKSTDMSCCPPPPTCRLEAETGIVLRFVVGTAAGPAQDAQVDTEQQQHGDILRLPLQVNGCQG